MKNTYQLSEVRLPSRAAAQKFARHVINAGGTPTLMPPGAGRSAWSVVYDAECMPARLPVPTPTRQAPRTEKKAKPPAPDAYMWEVYAGGVQGLRIVGVDAARAVAAQLGVMWKAQVQTGHISVKEDPVARRIDIELQQLPQTAGQ